MLRSTLLQGIDGVLCLRSKSRLDLLCSTTGSNTIIVLRMESALVGARLLFDGWPMVGRVDWGGVRFLLNPTLRSSRVGRYSIARRQV